MEKIQKKWKNIPKIAFFLMLCTTFSHISALHNMLIISHFVPQNKNLKKPEKKLLDGTKIINSLNSKSKQPTNYKFSIICEYLGASS
jgi:hypothetical protein